MSGRFGVYIHIPYCIQRCTYCDFATYVQTEIKPPENYISIIKKEIFNKRHLFPARELDTLYFGGGTPSLIPAELIVELISELAKFGYSTGPHTEITIEINPATVDEKKLEMYINAGVNRFSVGAQSFSNRLLKMVNREHDADQTVQTLKLLKKYDLNFSFDVLFALPTQTLSELRHDVQVALDLGSKHISPYCLTVPEGHPLSKNRPPDEEQLEMFSVIHQELSANSFERYEISNYALPGYESKHNLLYWTDEEYWGLGLSAHSYTKKTSWGSRFWNQSAFELYGRETENAAELETIANFPAGQIEHLQKNQSLTDFCYTSLRLGKGLSFDALAQKFGASTLGLVKSVARPMLDRQLIQEAGNHYILTETGIVVSNQIFEKFTFLNSDIDKLET